jgi:lysophospholipase L1-like esterase
MTRLVAVAAALLFAVVGCSSLPSVNATESWTPVTEHNIRVIGDSLTEGTAIGGKREANWVYLVWTKLRADGHIATIRTNAEGGAGYVEHGQHGHVLGDLQSGTDDDVVVFFGGSNDARHPLDAVAAAAAAAFVKARAADPTATLIVIGPLWLYKNPPDYALALRDSIHSAAEAAGALFVDPIADRWFVGTGLIGSDGLHPTDDGHRYMADKIGPVIEEALQP